MQPRGMLKTKAKKSIKLNYWKLLIPSLCMAFVQGNFFPDNKTQIQIEPMDWFNQGLGYLINIRTPWLDTIGIQFEGLGSRLWPVFAVGIAGVLLLVALGLGIIYTLLAVFPIEIDVR